jgi:hypothetical protein
MEDTAEKLRYTLRFERGVCQSLDWFASGAIWSELQNLYSDPGMALYSPQNLIIHTVRPYKLVKSAVFV